MDLRLALPSPQRVLSAVNPFLSVSVISFAARQAYELGFGYHAALLIIPPSYHLFLPWYHMLQQVIYIYI